MSTQPHQSAPSESNDVFDMERLPRDRPEQPPAPSADVAVPGQRLRPAHFAVASAAIAVLWIIWPASAPPLTRAQQNGRLLNAGAGTDGQESRQQPRAPTATAAPEPRPTASEDPPLQAQILDQQAQQATAIIKAVDSLNTRTAALEAQIAALARAPGKSDVWRQAQVSAKGTTRHEPAVKVLESFALNTVFDGQAWIGHDEKVFIVREGDMIEDIKVMHIDAKNHRVLTSRGVIR